MKTLAAVLAVLLLAAAALAGWQHLRLGTLGNQLAQAQGQAIAAGFELSAAQVSVQVVTRYVDRVRVVHDTTTQLQREIPAYVTPEMDLHFPLSVGFVRVHDAAVAGVPLEPAGPLDATASPVAASTAAGVIAGNVGVCRETAEQLTALQDWIHGQQTLRETRP